jgi:hypothetical protein
LVLAGIEHLLDFPRTERKTSIVLFLLKLKKVKIIYRFQNKRYRIPNVGIKNGQSIETGNIGYTRRKKQGGIKRDKECMFRDTRRDNERQEMHVP